MSDDSVSYAWRVMEIRGNALKLLCGVSTDERAVVRMGSYVLNDL
jgi:hypothetical protein